MSSENEFSVLMHTYKHFLPYCNYTDGVKDFIEEFEAYGLLDVIFSYIFCLRSDGDYFYPVKIRRLKGEIFEFKLGNKNNKKNYYQKIHLKNVIQDVLTFYLCDNEGGLGWTLMVPKEYQ